MRYRDIGVTVIQFRFYERGSNSECSRVVKCIAYTSEVADVDVARLRNGGNVLRERKVRVKDEAENACKGDRFEDSIWGDEES